MPSDARPMSATGRLLTLVLTVILVLYPALVYVGIQSFGPRILALILVAMALARLAAQRLTHQPLGNGGWLLLAAALAGGVTLMTGSMVGLKAYPVVVNLVLLGVFALSLWRSPTVIERLARLQTPDLPVHAIAYTRKVTWVWCGFLVANGAIAFATVYASDELWALYNGLLSYLAIGILLVGEYPLRKWVEYKHKANTRLEP